MTKTQIATSHDYRHETSFSDGTSFGYRPYFQPRGVFQQRNDEATKRRSIETRKRRSNEATKQRGGEAYEKHMGENNMLEGISYMNGSFIWRECLH